MEKIGKSSWSNIKKSPILVLFVNCQEGTAFIQDSMFPVLNLKINWDIMSYKILLLKVRLEI